MSVWRLGRCKSRARRDASAVFARADQMKLTKDVHGEATF